jgi:hypothetical protein
MTQSGRKYFWTSMTNSNSCPVTKVRIGSFNWWYFAAIKLTNSKEISRNLVAINMCQYMPFMFWLSTPTSQAPFHHCWMAQATHSHNRPCRLQVEAKLYLHLTSMALVYVTEIFYYSSRNFTSLYTRNWIMKFSNDMWLRKRQLTGKY